MPITTRSKLFRASKFLLLLVASCSSLTTIIIVARSLPYPYLKDLRSGYLLAQAMMHGVDPYLPLPELGRLYLPEHPFTNLLHPTPHPFSVGWLCLPLVLLSYEQAAIAWLIFQLGCLAVSIVLLSRIQGFAARGKRVAVLSFFLLGWWPLVIELWWAQLNLCLLVLFLCAWQALRRGKDEAGGILLGSVLLLKLAGWPIILWLALQRRWRAVWSAGLFWAGAHLLAIGWLGWGTIRDYYLKVGPQVGDIYRVSKLNLSLWTIGGRLFAEAGYHFVTTPLWESPWLVRVLTPLVPALVLFLAMRIAQRQKDFDTGFVILMGLGSFLNPIAWQTNFLLSVPALVMLFRRLRASGWPRLKSCAAFLLILMISLPHDLYSDWAKLFVTGVNASGQPVVPATFGLLTLAPLGALCLLLWLLTRLEWRMFERTTLNGDAIAPAWKEGEGALTAK